MTNELITNYENYIELLENWEEYTDGNDKNLYDNILDFWVNNYDREYQCDLYVYVDRIERDENKKITFRTECFENVGGNSYLDDDHFRFMKTGGTGHSTIIYEIPDFVNAFKETYPDKNIPDKNEYNEELSDYEQAEYIRLSYPEQFHALENECLRESDAVREWIIGLIDFELEESNKTLNELNEKEKYWIAYYDSYNNGYNQTPGGDTILHMCKLTPEEADEIAHILIDDPNGVVSHKQLAEKYGVSKDTIQAINMGRQWYNDNYTYPLHISKYDPRYKTESMLCVDCGKVINKNCEKDRGNQNSVKFNIQLKADTSNNNNINLIKNLKEINEFDNYPTDNTIEKNENKRKTKLYIYQIILENYRVISNNTLSLIFKYFN